MRTLGCLAALAAFAGSGLVALAQPATTGFTYQGELRTAGVPAAGLHDLRFRLYDALVGGAQLGGTLCADNVGVADGRFTVDLDFGGQFTGQQRFLEIEVRADSGLGCGNSAGFTILGPRQPLTAAPYAAFALGAATAASATTAATATNATQLNGQSGGFYQDAGNLSAGTLGSARLAGTYSGALVFSNAGNTFSGSGAGLTNLNAANIATGTLAPARLPSPFDISGSLNADAMISGTNNSATSQSIGVRGVVSSPTGTTYGGSFESASSNGIGVFGWATASTGINYGVFGVSNSTSGSGVYGRANPASGLTSGVYGQSNSVSGNGVYGTATAATGSAYGGYFESASAGGGGVFGWGTAATGTTPGVFGVSNSATGRGVFGRANATAGVAYGVFGQSNSSSGIGVYGTTVTSSGQTFAGLFENPSNQGIGAYGDATAASGTTSGLYGVSASTSGRGVVGVATGATGTTYGVLGAHTSASGWGLYANGRSGASGTKSFRIDHPMDPENKYLLHYSTESPEVLNAYSGTIILDGDGQAVVELPHYFAAINKSPRYTLTAVGAPMPMLHVGERISAADLVTGAAAEPGAPVPACWFRIAGGVPGGEVSWEVKAVRNDRWMQQRGAPVEIEKEGSEKGTYQHPGFYGQPVEKGLKDQSRPADDGGRQGPPMP